ncbi:hypothetical protein [Dyadobacter sp. 676]|uniref:Uncharacterized protein n=1 Tax=Dyadobacter sp. 676 TaxID=3088362 RepID=A0AAU8FTG0_9BACT
MYFFNLPGFDPDLGINLDDQGRFPYLRFVDHVFRRREADYLSQNFHFENIADKTMPPVFLSEPNLKAIFDYKDRKNVIVDHHSPISESYANELRAQFDRGYFDAMKEYPQQIVSILCNPDSESKITHLEQFIEFCSYHLYFEGFAVPSCIYTLGFIQAYLVRACGDRVNALRLVKYQHQVVSKKQELPVAEAQSNGPERIPLDYAIDEIISMWLILVDAWKCKAVGSIQVFTGEEEVLQLLGMMFEEKGGRLPRPEHKYFEMPPGNYERVLNLLMHATYKLNTHRNNIGLDRYCQLLLDTFSCYSKTKLESLRSNINKARGNIVQSIGNLTDSPHSKNVLKTLRKINEYGVDDLT